MRRDGGGLGNYFACYSVFMPHRAWDSRLNVKKNERHVCAQLQICYENSQSKDGCFISIILFFPLSQQRLRFFSNCCVQDNMISSMASNDIHPHPHWILPIVYNSEAMVVVLKRIIYGYARIDSWLKQILSWMRLVFTNVYNVRCLNGNRNWYSRS